MIPDAEQATSSRPEVVTVETARVRSMFRNSLFGAAAGTLIAVLLGAYLWFAHESVAAAGFALYFVLVGIGRVVVYLAYTKASDVDSNPESWLLAAMLTMLASGAGWGGAAWLFFDLEPVLITAIVVAMGISGLLLLAPAIQVLAAFNVPLFLGLAAKLVVAGTMAGYVTLVLLGLTVATMVIYAVGVQRQMVAQLDDAVERKRLSEVLGDSKLELESYNDRLAEEARQRTRVEDELKAAKISAEAANMAKDEFLATMSHEIRTPLNGILPILDILRSTPLNDSQRDYLNTAFQSSKHLLTIIDDILDYSKIEAGKLTLETVGINLRELLDSVVSLMASSADRKSIKLEIDIEQDVRLAMRGDPVRLKQVLTNLVSNAIKFTNEGSVTLSLARRQDFPAETELLFTVKDTGIGMDKQTADRLFRPFSQADASTTRTYGGTGLGLAICKRLVELMNGKIGVKSEENRGSVFWFTVRLKKSLGDIEAKTRPLEESRMLLVSKDKEFAQRLKIFCDRWETQVTLSTSLSDAAAKVDSRKDLGGTWRFDNVMLDEELGSGVGEFVLKARDNPKLAETGFLLLTDAGDLPAELAQLPGVVARPRSGSQNSLREGLEALLAGATVPPPESVSDRELGYETDEPVDAIAGTVLLVEDNPVNLHVAQKLLEVAGLEFDIAKNGKIALDLLKESPTRYQAVIMDCMMPVMDGYAATRAWRAYEEEHSWDRIPIIAMTANAMAGDREKCLEAGMDDYMAKPMNLSLLKKTVGHWMAKGGATPDQVPAPASTDGAEAAPSAAAAPAAQPTPATNRPPPRPTPSGVYVAMGAEPEVLDQVVLEDLREIMGADFDNLVRVFLEDSPKALRALVKAAKANDRDAMITPAHSLKSTSANLGALRLAEHSKILEHGARDGSLKQANKQIARIVNLYKQVAKELQDVLKADGTAG
ncbi:MAG: ATP-binding protein [Pseudomonadota bacterium]